MSTLELTYIFKQDINQHTTVDPAIRVRIDVTF